MSPTMKNLYLVEKHAMTRAIFITIVLFCTAVHAESRNQNSLLVYVFDVGQGLCTLTVAPDSKPSEYKYMVYDAGADHYKSKKCINAIDEVLGDSTTIDLMIVSHVDADHLYNADDVLVRYTVKKIFRTGYQTKYKKKDQKCEYNSDSWCEFAEKLSSEVFYEFAEDLNLSANSNHIEPGAKFELGGAIVNFIAGWSTWDNSLSEDKGINATSIVVRLEFKERSILFTGDTVGRGKDDDESSCKHAEAVMVGRHYDPEDAISIDSDVIIAPHHGANNASSTCFIDAVSPKWVVFSAGKKYGHPCLATYDRYYSHNKNTKFFRTDFSEKRETDKSCEEMLEATADSVRDSDTTDDDHIRIEISPSGGLTVAYVRSLDSKEVE